MTLCAVVEDVHKTAGSGTPEGKQRELGLSDATQTLYPRWAPEHGSEPETAASTANGPSYFQGEGPAALILTDSNCSGDGGAAQQRTADDSRGESEGERRGRDGPAPHKPLSIAFERR